MSDYRITIPQADLDTYGLGYPVTYEFDIPAGSSGLTAYMKRSDAGGWERLPTTAFGHDGIDGCRFDYTANRAYLSVSFGPDSNYIDVHIRAASGLVLDEVAYAGVCTYYDNRAAGCVMTYDDMRDGTDDYQASLDMLQAHIDRKLWVSAGVNAGAHNNLAGIDPLTAAQYTEIQTYLDQGYVELMNHGYTHKRADLYGTYGTGTEAEDAEEEIGYGLQVLKDNLTHPPQNRRGTVAYLPGYIEPHGISSTAARAALDSHGYLSDRMAGFGVTGTGNDYATFAADGLFARQGASYFTGDPSTSQAEVDAAIAVFDGAVTQGLLYVNYSYARGVDWTDPLAPMNGLLDHVAGRNNVWYVGWGQMYSYRFVALNASVAERAVDGYVRRGGTNVEARTYALRDGVFLPAN